MSQPAVAVNVRSLDWLVGVAILLFFFGGFGVYLGVTSDALLAGPSMLVAGCVLIVGGCLLLAIRSAVKILASR